MDFGFNTKENQAVLVYLVQTKTGSGSDNCNSGSDCQEKLNPYPILNRQPDPVVVYHATIVSIGHYLLMKCWPTVLGCVLRTEGSSPI